MPKIVMGADDEPDQSGRQSARKNIFIAATLVCGEGSEPVRVRNLSKNGALLECFRLLPKESEATLRRGSLHAKGRIIWSSASRAGMEFSEPIDLRLWIPKVRSKGQMDVDHDIAQSRRHIDEMLSAESLPVRRRHVSMAHLAEELFFVARRLEGLGNNLTNEPGLVARHSAQLQELDISVQILSHLARLLVADCSEEALSAIGMEDLRRRLERKSPNSPTNKARPR